jgi:hypothetical protein
MPFEPVDMVFESWDGTLLLKQLSKKFNKAKQLC